VALTARLPGLGQFMTVDEESWMLRSGTFWHELFRQGNPGGTFVTTHPGALTTWLAGAGIVWQEHRLGFDIDTSNLRQFRFAATLPMALTAAGMIGIVSWLFGRLLNWWVSLIGGVLLASEPYLVGMSQIVHVDMLLGLSMTAAVLCILLYWRDRRVHWLAWCGVFTGLAMAQKLLPALWLWVYFAMLFVMKGRSVSLQNPAVLLPKGEVADMVRRLGIVLGIASLMLYAVWPALWVKTGLDRYYMRDVVAITADRHVEIDETKTGATVQPATFYLRTVLGRESPVILLMSAGITLLFVRYIIELYVLRRPFSVRSSSYPEEGDGRLVPIQVIGWLLFFAVSFLVFITVPAKQADRYALPALIVMPLLAGIGWYIFFRLALDWLGRHGEECGFCRIAKPLLAAAAGFMLLLRPAAAAPYTIAYNNPWLPNIRPASQQGWGEGLEAAAAWLNERPSADQLYIASWYPGVTATYFRGKTLSLSSREDHRVGYVLVYRNMFGRAPDEIASNVLDEIRGREPVHTVTVLGRPYVWIYSQLGLWYFRQHVGELIGEMEVGQTVPITADTFSGIDIGLATFSGRENTHDVVLHVRRAPDTVDDLRTVHVNAAELEDGSYHHFAFVPIPDAAGKTFFVSLTSPTSVPGNAVTVRFSGDDLLPGTMALRREALPAGQTNADFIRAGDIAYQLP